MSIEEENEVKNKSVVRRYFDLYNQGDMQSWPELFSPDLVCYVGGVPEPIHGLGAALDMDAYLHAAFSNIRYGVEDIFGEGDKVAVRRTWSMRHTGEYAGIPATGRELSGTAIEIFRLDDGKIVEVWTETDNLSFMQDLGAMPATEGV